MRRYIESVFSARACVCVCVCVIISVGWGGEGCIVKNWLPKQYIYTSCVHFTSSGRGHPSSSYYSSLIYNTQVHRKTTTDGSKPPSGLTRVTLRVSHVQSRAARIGEHVQHVFLPPRALDHRAVLEDRAPPRRLERAVPLPVSLPLRFDEGEGIPPRDPPGGWGGWGGGRRRGGGGCGVFRLALDGAHPSNRGGGGVMGGGAMPR